MDQQEAEKVEELLVESGFLTEQQARVYKHRDLLDLSRHETADQLGVEVSTIDSQLRDARDKVTSLFDVFSGLSQISAVPIRRSNNKTWHRVDGNGCDRSQLVKPSNPYHSRIEKFEDVDDLPGKPCPACFQALTMME